MSTSKHQIELPLKASRQAPGSRAARVRESPAFVAAERRYERMVTATPAAHSSEIRREPCLVTATPTFIALTDLPNLRAAGIVYPSTVHGWRWLFRHRHERGLEDAFRRIGRRIVVDAQRYQELLRASSGG
jgi:hypothetical protein